ncbi:CvpA family protein [Sulfurospirillum barnesii]|uniref:Putative membrane protein, required for colicin V production n=1 Tax=Sulfurospirillum barnesii (strain ATCC 700032 / DSM 10660 / SES-3) TaxID=760154 RepID=I3XVH0_SULBS|nr:CvpA family protein [Sulfurospirillum barnesii]AFL67944.1 putative membrane protein, required for colicin V production [Sulfurospirillum barnesii SES-3]
MTPVSMFDIISLALILILGIKGILNGFVKEVFGLFGIVGGIYFASRYAAEAGELIHAHLFAFSNKASLYLFGFIAVLILFWVSALFLGYLVSHIINLSGLGAIDKLAGFAVGSIKIFLVFSVLAVALNNIEFIKSRIEPYVTQSMMFPLFLEAGQTIVKLDANTMLESIQAKEKINP